MQSRLFQSLILFIFSACVSASFADVTVIGVSGYSRYAATSTTTGTTPSSNYSIFGGYAGAYGGCAGSQTTTDVCNSCSALESLPNLTKFSCSQTSIHPDLDLVVTLRFSTVPSTPVEIVKISANGTAVALTPVITGSLTANTDITYRVKWSEICSKMSIANCVGTGTTAHFNTTIEFGLGSNASDFDTASVQRFTIKYNYRDAASPNDVLNSGCSSSVPFCAFAVKPGDEKVYVQDLTRGSLGPNSDIKWQSLRVYYALNDGNWTIPMGIGAGAQSETFEILDQSTVTSNLSNNKVPGLVNEQEYMFTIASVDETTVIQDILSSTSLTAASHVAKPGKVVGLLEKKCFIATAAFGSPMAPQVEALRKFRNQYLLPNPWGQKFVETYYQYSPPIAQFISEHEFLRSAVRAALWPLVVSADLLIGSQNSELQDRGSKE